MLRSGGFGEVSSHDHQTPTSVGRDVHMLHESTIFSSSSTISSELLQNNQMFKYLTRSGPGLVLDDPGHAPSDREKQI